MGWTTTDRRDDGMTDREFIEFYELRGVEILDHAKAGSTHFFVYKSPTTGQNSVIVALTTRHGTEFSVKVLDESVGPADDRCPRRILDRLGTPPNEWAAQWRQRCHDRRAGAGKTALKAGDVIRFAAPIKFTHGHEYQTFEFVERSTFKADSTGTLVTITRWRERTDWTLLVETGPTAERYPERPAEPSVAGPRQMPSRPGRVRRAFGAGCSCSSVCGFAAPGVSRSLPRGDYPGSAVRLKSAPVGRVTRDRLRRPLTRTASGPRTRRQLSRGRGRSETHPENPADLRWRSANRTE